MLLDILCFSFSYFSFFLFLIFVFCLVQEWWAPKFFSACITCCLYQSIFSTKCFFGKARISSIINCKEGCAYRILIGEWDIWRIWDCFDKTDFKNINTTCQDRCFIRQDVPSMDYECCCRQDLCNNSSRTASVSNEKSMKTSDPKTTKMTLNNEDSIQNTKGNKKRKVIFYYLRKNKGNEGKRIHLYSLALFTTIILFFQYE